MRWNTMFITAVCVIFLIIAIYTFKNTTNKLSLPVKAFDLGLKLLEREA